MQLANNIDLNCSTNAIECVLTKWQLPQEEAEANAEVP